MNSTPTLNSSPVNDRRQQVYVMTTDSDARNAAGNAVQRYNAGGAVAATAAAALPPPTAAPASPGPHNRTSSVIGAYQSQGVAGAKLVDPLLKALEKMGVKHPGQPGADQVAYRLNKYVRAEKNSLKKQLAMQASINNWKNSLPSPENQKLLDMLNNINTEQATMQDSLIQKLENIQLQLEHVFDREKKVDEKSLKRADLVAKVRIQERQIGPGMKLQIAKDRIPEVDATLEVLQKQLANAINTSLKGSIVDYVISMQSGNNQLRVQCDKFFGYINSEVVTSQKPRQTLDYCSAAKIRPASSSPAEANDNDDEDNNDKENEVENVGIQLKDRTNEFINLNDLGAGTAAGSSILSVNKSKTRNNDNYSSQEAVGADVGSVQTQPVKHPSAFRIASLLKPNGDDSIW